MSDQPQLPLGRLTLEPGFALAYALEPEAPTPASQAADLGYLAARSFPRWAAAVAPPWPDHEEVYRCEKEARDLAQALMGYPQLPERDLAWNAVSSVSNTLAVYALGALVVHTCREWDTPTTLDQQAFPGLARACRDALRTAQAAVNELKTTLEDLCE